MTTRRATKTRAVTSYHRVNGSFLLQIRGVNSGRHCDNAEFILQIIIEITVCNPYNNGRKFPVIANLFKEVLSLKMKCPDCGTTVPTYQRYTTWCECGWNLKPYEPDFPPSIFDRMYVEISKRLFKNFFTSMKSIKDLEPRLTKSILLSYMLSTIILGLLLFVFLLGIVFFIKGLDNFLWFFLSFFFLFFFWYSFPKKSKYSKFQHLLTRDISPNLFKAIDKITDKLKAKKVERVVITEDFNASYTEFEIKRMPVLTIGLPLFTILTTEEKIALLSHEVAHGVNGDIKRKFIVIFAYQVLYRWYYLFSRDEDNEDPSILLLSQPIMKLFSYFPLALLYVMNHLVCYDSQKAEFLADYKASTISGTRGAISLMHKFHFFDSFMFSIQRSALNQLPFFETYQTVLQEVPQREIERIMRVQYLSESRLDYSHPPTAHRITLPTKISQQYCPFTNKGGRCFSDRKRIKTI